MPFAAGLQESLQVRGNQFPTEFTRGDSLEHVLDRHLLAVEAMADVELLTSILLLSPDGKRLFHGAAPNLPQSYRDAIDGMEIGPSAGSCGTAAYFGKPVYVTDIATNPLWNEYRHLALPLGLRSCWSTPIRDAQGAVIGTFAIYHRTAGSPTTDELDAIDMITGHVAEAIMWARGRRAQLKLVSDDRSPPETESDRPDRLLTKVARLEAIAADLERYAANAGSEECAAALRAVAEDSRTLASLIRRQVGPHSGTA